MKQIIFNILSQKNLLNKGYDIEELYKAGIDNIMLSIEYYHDKPYTCQSVLQELFQRGVLKKLKEN